MSGGEGVGGLCGFLGGVVGMEGRRWVGLRGGDHTRRPERWELVRGAAGGSMRRGVDGVTYT